MDVQVDQMDIKTSAMALVIIAIIAAMAAIIVLDTDGDGAGTETIVNTRDFTSVDPDTGSGMSGTFTVTDRDGELGIRLVADMHVAEGDRDGMSVLLGDEVVLGDWHSSYRGGHGTVVVGDADGRDGYTRIVVGEAPDAGDAMGGRGTLVVESTVSDPSSDVISFTVTHSPSVSDTYRVQLTPSVYPWEDTYGLDRIAEGVSVTGFGVTTVDITDGYIDGLTYESVRELQETMSSEGLVILKGDVSRLDGALGTIAYGGSAYTVVLVSSEVGKGVTSTDLMGQDLIDYIIGWVGESLRRAS